jgi:hypothetical protein
MMKHYEILKKPLKLKAADREGWLTGVIAVDLSEIIDLDLEQFLDLIAVRLSGSELLCDIDYAVVGHAGDELHLKVSGDTSMMRDET